MAFSYIAGVAAASQNGGGFSTPAIDTTGADLIVAALSWYSGPNGSADPGLVDSKGNSWTGLTARTDGTNTVRLLYCRGPAVGPGHTFGAPGADAYASLGVVAFSGSAAAPFAAESGSSAASATSIRPGALTPPQAGCLVVTGLVLSAQVTPSGDPGFASLVTTGTNGKNAAGGIGWLAQSAAASANPQWTWPGAAGADAAMATFRPAAASPAAGYSLASSPASVPVGSAVTITATADGAVAGADLAIALADSLASTGTKTITIPVGATTGSTAITPTVAGTHAITATHAGGGFAGGDGSASFAATAATFVPVADPALLFSPGNWFSDGPGAIGATNVRASAAYALTNNPGAYLRFHVLSGGAGSVAVRLDTSILAGIAPANCPVLAWRVDGAAPYGAQQLAYSASPVVVALAGGLAAGEHRVAAWFKAVDQANASSMGDRWNDPATGFAGIKLLGVLLDTGSTAVAPPARPRRALWLGDSSLECVQMASGSLGAAGQDATSSYGLLAAPGLDAEVGVVGFAAQGYSQAGYGNVPALYSPAAADSAWRSHFAGASRLGQPLDYLICSHGINGGATAATVRAWIAQARADYPAAKILVAVPWNGAARAAVAAGVASYKASAPGDAAVYLVDGGTNLGALNNGDSNHPNYQAAGLAAAAYVGAARDAGAVGVAPARRIHLSRSR